jgi:hypothetical protein
MWSHVESLTLGKHPSSETALMNSSVATHHDVRPVKGIRRYGGRVCCFVVEGLIMIASWSDGVIPICGVLTGGGACSLIVENLVTGLLRVTGMPVCKEGKKLYT